MSAAPSPGAAGRATAVAQAVPAAGPHLPREAATVNIDAASTPCRTVPRGCTNLCTTALSRVRNNVRNKQLGRRRIPLVTTVALGVKCVAERGFRLVFFRG